MLKQIFISCMVSLLSLSVTTALADGRSSQLLSGVESRIESMGGYRVDFTIGLKSSSINGYYEVRGDSYYLKVGTSEVYCDGRVRYEVSADNREVVIDNVDPTSHNILQNPTKAFKLVDGGYSHSLLSEKQGSATIRLIPQGKGGDSATIDLKIRLSDMQPLSIIYNTSSDAIDITVNSFVRSQTPLKSFSMALYPGYEMIDFR